MQRQEDHLRHRPVSKSEAYRPHGKPFLCPRLGSMNPTYLPPHVGVGLAVAAANALINFFRLSRPCCGQSAVVRNQELDSLVETTNRANPIQIDTNFAQT